MNFKITFFLDGTGIYYTPGEPMHLDALLGWALAPFQKNNSTELLRDEIPIDIRLPLLRSKINGHDVWHASALFPIKEGYQETLRFWRKKFRQNYISETQGSPNLQNGIYREYNMPVPLILVTQMVAFASGDRYECLRILRRHIKYLGKKRSYGYGKIVRIEAEETQEDYSFLKNNITMRWLPHPNGTLFVRAAPPYWNTCDRTLCLNVGEDILRQNQDEETKIKNLIDIFNREKANENKN